MPELMKYTIGLLVGVVGFFVVNLIKEFKGKIKQNELDVRALHDLIHVETKKISDEIKASHKEISKEIKDLHINLLKEIKEANALMLSNHPTKEMCAEKHKNAPGGHSVTFQPGTGSTPKTAMSADMATDAFEDCVEVAKPIVVAKHRRKAHA